MSQAINILPIIAAWLDEFPYASRQDMPRPTILAWLRNKFPDWCNDRNRYHLTADCLIAAGIGRAEEQGSTVYCRCTYGDPTDE